MALGRMITGFIAVIVGAALVPTLVTIINGTVAELETPGLGVDNNVALTDLSNTTLSAKVEFSNAQCSDLAMINASGGESIAGGNFTFSGGECTFIMNGGSPYIGGEGNLTYDFTHITGTQGSSASLLELTILFFSLGVMIAGVGTSVSGLVEYGLI